MSGLSKSVNVPAVSNVTGVNTNVVSLDEVLSDLLKEGEELRNLSRDHFARVKKVISLVSKERKLLSKKRKKTKRVIKQNPQTVNKQMQKFMKDNKDILSTGTIAPSTEYVRRDMMRVVSAYVKVKNLQIETNRKEWIPDKTLKKLFVIKESNAKFSFMNVNGLITRVIVK
jgi:hypothetical protein